MVPRMDRRADLADPMLGVDAAEMRAILAHEARVHALPGRELRELDDGLLLYDPRDGDPFWNRFEAVRWPSEPAAFDRRLDELMVQFASFGRRPHVWASPGHIRRPTSSAASWMRGSRTSAPG